jgi:hypothetical protein
VALWIDTKVIDFRSNPETCLVLRREECNMMQPIYNWRR